MFLLHTKNQAVTDVSCEFYNKFSPLQQNQLNFDALAVEIAVGLMNH